MSRKNTKKARPSNIASSQSELTSHHQSAKKNSARLPALYLKIYNNIDLTNVKITHEPLLQKHGNAFGLTPLAYAIICYRSETYFEYFLAENDTTPFHFVVQEKESEYYGLTPEMIAAKVGNLDFLNFLFPHRKEVKLKKPFPNEPAQFGPHQGLTPFQIAIKHASSKKSIQCINFYLKHLEGERENKESEGQTLKKEILQSVSSGRFENFDPIMLIDNDECSTSIIKLILEYDGKDNNKNINEKIENYIKRAADIWNDRLSNLFPRNLKSTKFAGKRKKLESEDELNQYLTSINAMRQCIFNYVGAYRLVCYLQSQKETSSDYQQKIANNILEKVSYLNKLARLILPRLKNSSSHIVALPIVIELIDLLKSCTDLIIEGKYLCKEDAQLMRDLHNQRDRLFSLELIASESVKSVKKDVSSSAANADAHTIDLGARLSEQKTEELQVNSTTVETTFSTSSELASSIESPPPSPTITMVDVSSSNKNSHLHTVDAPTHLSEQKIVKMDVDSSEIGAVAATSSSSISSFDIHSSSSSTAMSASSEPYVSFDYDRAALPPPFPPPPYFAPPYVKFCNDPQNLSSSASSSTQPERQSSISPNYQLLRPERLPPPPILPWLPKHAPRPPLLVPENSLSSQKSKPRFYSSHPHKQRIYVFIKEWDKVNNEEYKGWTVYFPDPTAAKNICQQIKNDYEKKIISWSSCRHRYTNQMFLFSNEEIDLERLFQCAIPYFTFKHGSAEKHRKKSEPVVVKYLDTSPNTVADFVPYFYRKTRAKDQKGLNIIFRFVKKEGSVSLSMQAIAQKFKDNDPNKKSRDKNKNVAQETIDLFSATSSPPSVHQISYFFHNGVVGAPAEQKDITLTNHSMNSSRCSINTQSNEYKVGLEGGETKSSAKNLIHPQENLSTRDNAMSALPKTKPTFRTKTKKRKHFIEVTESSGDETQIISEFENDNPHGNTKFAKKENTQLENRIVTKDLRDRIRRKDNIIVACNTNTLQRLPEFSQLQDDIRALVTSKSKKKDSGVPNGPTLFFLMPTISMFLHAGYDLNPKQDDEIGGDSYLRLISIMEGIKDFLTNESYVDFRPITVKTEEQKVTEPEKLGDILIQNRNHDVKDTFSNDFTVPAVNDSKRGIQQAIDVLFTGEEIFSPLLICCIRPPGHHSEKDEYTPFENEGFCYLNTLYAAAVHAKQYLPKRKSVLAIDADVHDGNGTKYIFLNQWTDADHMFFFVNIYDKNLYPHASDSSSEATDESDNDEITSSNKFVTIYDIPFPRGATTTSTLDDENDNDEEVLEQIKSKLQNIDVKNVGVILISLGLDSHLKDPQNQPTSGYPRGIRLSEGFYPRMVIMLRETVGIQVPVVIIPEGGYRLSTTRNVYRDLPREVIHHKFMPTESHATTDSKSKVTASASCPESAVRLSNWKHGIFLPQPSMPGGSNAEVLKKSVKFEARCDSQKKL